MKKYLIVAAFTFFITAFVLLVLRGREDYWICKSGQWVKNGQPSYPKPIVSCGIMPTLPKSKEKCLELGGVWKKLGPDPWETCNFKAKDRGNVCYDSSECEGNCQVDLSKEELREGMRGKSWIRHGQCSVWVVELGCQGIVRDGKTSVICFD
ncbi:hypothetical protein COY90_02205 [Candidatus Roizmanbacteria bacterium CG_4_10_14_0_8_um_filter_39_9]|uniref:Uncharacterized protein n=1 Tax=Candidatus Roizmanbacteria bacterium CG_4_10_14_0_8_um_filter_39_9 TaxID=1974829 RepID=A0A2M7QE29_9BACT|nr:MAG: hypothetical protein COY90_02205 [Candidatus Roizmanbacteria bacterium CG_4_10_14_0_8_um_filter_39_9]